MNKRLWIGIAAILTIAVAVAFVRTWNSEWPYPSQVHTLEQRGQFGDSFAIFSATVSALGFLGIVLTLVLQQWQISQQAAELQRQAARDEANRRRDEIAQYDQVLFRLLDFYKESVDSIRIVRKGVEVKGRDALSLVLEQMQAELRRRKIHFIPEREMAPLRVGAASDAQRLLFDYVTVETCRVIQYTVIYQRRVIATLRALLKHMEFRCPENIDKESYRELVSSQITHVEIQYIFATALIHASEDELRQLLEKSLLFARDSAPYNFKFHQYLYQHLWGSVVGDPTKARKLAFKPKRSAAIRESALVSPLSDLLKKYSISTPVTPEGISQSQKSDHFNSITKDGETRTK